MEQWAEIRRLHRSEGVPIREIARRLGVARNTVRAALASDTAPKYSRPATGDGADDRGPPAPQPLKALFDGRSGDDSPGIRVGWSKSLTLQLVANLCRFI